MVISYAIPRVLNCSFYIEGKIQYAEHYLLGKDDEGNQIIISKIIAKPPQDSSEYNESEQYFNSSVSGPST